MKRILLCIAALSMAGPCFSQTEEKASEQVKFYRLDFALKEVEAGKVINSRGFSMNISQNAAFNSSSVRTGDKIPVSSGKEGQFTYVDVGVNIDCRSFRVIDSQVVVQVVADISTVGAQVIPPAIIQTKWSGGAMIPLRKPTILFSADGASQKRQMQLELTVTPVP